MIRPNARSPSITSQESYLAVMITDLIADVPVPPAPETEEAAKTTKEATNLAYDAQLDGDIRSPTLDDTSQKANGASISKGVLLNAVHFAQNDSKNKSDEKPMQLTATLAVPALIQQTSEPKGFKTMSLSRKIAFGFSFLPSVLFVLCFAVILPCNVPPPCVTDTWFTEFNDTEATTGLKIPENIVFTVLKEGKNVLFHLNKDNGDFSEIKLDAKSTYLECGKIMNKDKIDCIIVDESGKVYSFNDTNSTNIWNPISEENEHVSNPVILSGCEEGLEAVSLAISSTKMKVLHGGNRVSVLTISDCDSVPTRLMPWVIDGSSNIIFICEKNGEERLVSIPKNVWCVYSNNSTEKPIILKSGAIDSLKKSVLQPLNNGIVLWSENEVSMIQQDGTYLWKVSNLTHPTENRFILYGNFHDEDKQVALISSNLLSGLKITLLNPSDGSIIKSTSHSNFEATEVVHVEGKKKDFVLLLLKKIDKNIVNSAISQINDISTTIVNLISSEEVNNTMQHTVSEELAILDLDGNMDSIRELRTLKGVASKRNITAITNKDTGLLSIYILSTYDKSQMKTTEVRNINVANLEKSIKSRCKI